MASVVPQRQNEAEPLRFGHQPINAVDPLVERMAYWMDESISIPGTNRKIGFDALIGLIPGLGDLVTILPAYFMLREAKRLGLPKIQRATIVGTYVLDIVIGAVPLFGDLLDCQTKRWLMLSHQSSTGPVLRARRQPPRATTRGPV